MTIHPHDTQLIAACALFIWALYPAVENALRMVGL